MKRTCQGCADRHEACHDTCEKYKQWKAEWNASMQYVREKNATNVCEYAIKVHDRNLKRRR